MNDLLVFYSPGLVDLTNHIIPSVLFGLFTCILPWFILMPSIGKGLFGRKMSIEAKPIIAPIISHIAYGLGIGILFNMFH